MTEHPNAVTVRRSFEAWNSGRLDVIREYISEDAVLHFAGNNAMSGTYRGRDAVMDALARASQAGGSHSDVESVLASDDHVIVFFRLTHERDGKTLDVVQAMPIKVNAEGKLTEGWFLANDQRAFDQFWS
jgi:ketosteroid isomerase-like protein